MMAPRIEDARLLKHRAMTPPLAANDPEPLPGRADDAVGIGSGFDWSLAISVVVVILSMCISS
jgi:hypothetical protein